MTNRKKLPRWAAWLLALLLLVGCGSPDAKEPETEPPAERSEPSEAPEPEALRQIKPYQAVPVGGPDDYALILLRDPEAAAALAGIEWELRGTMPVYETLEALSRTAAELDETARQYAERGGTSITASESQYDDGGVLYEKQYVCEDGMEIDVWTSGAVTLIFPTAGIDGDPEDPAYGQAVYERYGAYLDMDSPAYRLNLANWQPQSMIFDGVPTAEQPCPKRVSFLADSNGRDCLYLFPAQDLGESLGNYPVISQEAAEAILLSGGGTVENGGWCPVTDAAQILGCYLDYLGDPCQPVYVFLVEATAEVAQRYLVEAGMEDGGDRYVCQRYFVPAVDPAYLIPADTAAVPEPEPEVAEEAETPAPESWRRYPGEIPDYPDLHVEDAQGNDVSAELIDLWYASSAVYNVDDNRMFRRGDMGDNYAELPDYEPVASSIFTENGKRQLELTHLGLGNSIPFPLIRLENGTAYRKTGWKTGYFYGGALKDMEVLTAETDRLTVLVTYQRDWGGAAPDPDPQYDTLEWVVVQTDGLWKVERYPYPEDNPDGMLYSTKGTYTDSLGNEWDYSYEIPLIRFDCKDAETVNREIRDGMGARVAEELANMEEGLSLSVNRVSYQRAGKDRVVTLILKAEYVWEYTDYAVYHYDQDLNRFLTNEEMLRRLGKNPEIYLRLLREAAEQEFLDSVPDGDLEVLGGQEFYDRQYAATLSEENLNLDTMLFFQGGKLYAIVPIYGFAGADWYYHIIPINI